MRSYWPASSRSTWRRIGNTTEGVLRLVRRPSRALSAVQPRRVRLSRSLCVRNTKGPRASELRPTFQTSPEPSLGYVEFPYLWQTR